jgi:predicted ester cyclase
MGFRMARTRLGTSTSSESGRCSRRHVIVAATAVLGWQLLGARQSPAYSQEMKMRNDAATGSTRSPLDHQALADGPVPDGGNGIMTRDQLVARLKRAGELEISGEDQAETDSYFDPAHFRFHAPDGFETDYAGLTNYFKAIRAAFDDRSIRRGIIVAEGNYIACQTWIEGRFVREFTQSPAGSLPPNGQRVVWDLSNIFRFDDQGRLVEEWVRTDYRSFLRQLGAPGK